MRIVFFGTAEFAVPSLKAVLAAGHEVLAVVTQPDKPQGRGRQLVASPIKMAAERHRLPVLQPRRVRFDSFLATMRDLSPDVLALAAFGQVIPQALLDLPPLGPINVHGSLLPKYRGAAPIQRALMAGETKTGVTTMWMDATLDTGDMLLEASLAIAPEDTAGTLTPRLALLGADLLIKTLEGLQNGTLARRKQDDSQATFAPAITPEDGSIRWDESATGICNRIRGVSPKPGAYSQIKGKRVKIVTALPVASPSLQTPSLQTPSLQGPMTLSVRTQPDNQETSLEFGLEPGTLIGRQKSPAGLLVAAGNSTILLITEVQPDSGKRMAASDWALGQRIVQGDKFGPHV